MSLLGLVAPALPSPGRSYAVRVPTGVGAPVMRLIPGVDGYADPGAGCSDFRGATIVDGAGHWIQQEAPAETNAALEAFLASL